MQGQPRILLLPSLPAFLPAPATCLVCKAPCTSHQPSAVDMPLPAQAQPSTLHQQRNQWRRLATAAAAAVHGAVAQQRQRQAAAPGLQQEWRLRQQP